MFERKVTPKYTIKVNFGVTFYLLCFFGILHLRDKSVDHDKTKRPRENNSNWIFYIQTSK